MLLAKPKVIATHRKEADGTVRESWLVYCGRSIEGISVKFYRSSEKEAREKAKEMSEKVKRIGQAATLLTAEQTYDASEAFQMLADAEAGITLAECARQWMERNRDALECKTAIIRDALEEYLGRFDGRKNHYNKVRNALTKLTAPFGDLRRMSELDRLVVESFLSLYNNPKTFNLNRGYVMAFLNWARKNGKYTQDRYNACLCIERKKEPYRTPRFLHADAVEKIMRWCEAQPDAGMLVPKFAIGFFAGVRSDEIARMDWKDVHFAEMEIRIETPKGVTGTPPRIVGMSDNLAAWLKPYSKDTGKMCYSGAAITGRKKKIAEDTGVEFGSKEMRNVCRHTFATMHAAAFRNFELTASEMGHGASTSMLMKHYKSITGKSDAVAFWNIMPENDIRETRDEDSEERAEGKAET
jgi:integrase